MVYHHFLGLARIHQGSPQLHLGGLHILLGWLALTKCQCRDLDAAIRGIHVKDPQNPWRASLAVTMIGWLP